jgi:UDP:flavonoid glycosyltransferase YjiC (YdhE family)
MRLIFAAPPDLGMVFPLIPLAQAAVSAGHRVLFATASSSVRLIAEAGLPVVDVAPETDFAVLLPSATEAFLSNRPDAEPVDTPRPHFFQQLADAMTEHTIRLAARWRPDALVHPPEGVVARAVFGKLGVPTVFHGFSFQHHPTMIEPWKRGGSAAIAESSLAGWGNIASIDISPPSMSMVDPFGWAMRYVPYSGGGILPDWLFDKTGRPRVAVTIGTVAPQLVGVDPLRWLLTAAPHVDAEFVFALGGADPGALGDLPANVRAVSWIPLTALLPTCVAAVHHGGAGSTMTALDAGLPQAVLPQGADQFDNARAISDRGAGFVASTKESAVFTVKRLLSDPALTAAAREVRQEIAALPGPTEIVHRLAAVVAKGHRG